MATALSYFGLAKYGKPTGIRICREVQPVKQHNRLWNSLLLKYLGCKSLNSPRPNCCYVDAVFRTNPESQTLLRVALHDNTIFGRIGDVRKKPNRYHYAFWDLIGSVAHNYIVLVGIFYFDIV